MTVSGLAVLLMAAVGLGWHARDRIHVPPGFDATMTRRLARKLWRRRRRS